MTRVLLGLFLSQTRVFMAMARDGLLPPVFGRVHRRWRTPHVATIVVNLDFMLFLPVDTWLRLVVWLAIGFVRMIRAMTRSKSIVARPEPKAGLFLALHESSGGPYNVSFGAEALGFDLLHSRERWRCGHDERV